MAAPLPTMQGFLARCLEEIGLEGRCGLPVCDLFDLVDARSDVAYRTRAWSALCAMSTHQLRFHIMHPLPASETAAGATTSMPADYKSVCHGAKAVVGDSPRRRKRKWVTTLTLADDSPARPKTNLKACKTPNQIRQPVLPSMRRIAAKKERRRRLSGADKELLASESDAVEDADTPVSSERRKRRRRWSDDAMLSSGEAPELHNQSLDLSQEQQEDVKQSGDSSTQDESAMDIKEEIEDKADESVWVFRSPRGYRLGEEVDVADLSYEDALASSPEGVLGIVASEHLRLQYLGVLDPSGMETISPQYDLLEIIGRARERGEDAASLTNSRLFGDSRKLHYLLDMLVGSSYVKKNIITAERRRFNIVHLTRFAQRFHPSMISRGAMIERDAFPKERLAQAIVTLLQARGERTCVFADIGRELGYGKRQQEQLRNFFLQQMHQDPKFPLQLFMARCNTGTDNIGRKLWCVRLRDDSSQRRTSSQSHSDRSGSTSPGPVIEQGIMEQLYASIRNRGEVGATVPELRDILGVPTFKLPYKLAQSLISNYNISVEQVVMGKSTMYRLFIPGATDKNGISNPDSEPQPASSAPDKNARHGCDGADTVPSVQPGTMREATRGAVRASTASRRKQYILHCVQQRKIISIHQLRSGLIEAERSPDQVGTEWGLIDIRSVRRILDDLEAEKAVVSMDITLPPKKLFQKQYRVVKCVALPGFQRDREAIREFVDEYVKEYQKKYLVKDSYHNNDEYVVISSRRRRRRGSADQEKRENPTQESSQHVVKYAAASYKLARIQLVRLHKQSRKLGMFFGAMYRCRSFHLLIWSRLDSLETRDTEAECNSNDSTGSKSDPTSIHSTKQARRTFVLKELLDVLTVSEYIGLVGVCELLTEAEEVQVKSAVASGCSWNVLPDEIVQKIRGLESDRFSKILRILIELELLQVVRRTSQDLLDMFRSAEDFDSTVSKVAFATLSGGIFQVKDQARIILKRGAKIIRQLPSPDAYVYASSFSWKSRSDHLSGRVPVDFCFRGIEDVKQYWKSLKFLSVEGAQMGKESPTADGVSINEEGGIVRSAPLKHQNIYVLKSWVSQATTTTSNASARLKAAAAATGPLHLLKRKRFFNGTIGVAEGTSSQKKQKTRQSIALLVPQLLAPSDGDSVAAMASRHQSDSKVSLRASKWTLEDDLRLMDLYVDDMSCHWFIDVPLALQKRGENVAFRTTELSRGLISWKKIGEALKKKPNHCLLRVKELSDSPVFKSRVERTKATITQMKNPDGVFHEERQIVSNPRLTALLCRALQVILHERSTYYSVLADMLISQWNESEVKLVWRYLWLADLISRTSRVNERRKQKERGFQLHSRVLDMTGLKIGRYSMGMFCRAAEHFAFLDDNAREEIMLSDGSADTPTYFEYELDANAPPSHVAVDLAAVVTEQAVMIPEFAPTEPSTQESDEGDRIEPVKGLTGHLSRKCNGISPDGFLRDYWSIKLRFTHDNDVSRTKATEAFSNSCMVPRSSRGQMARPSNVVREWLSSQLSEVTSAGSTLADLVAKRVHSEASLSDRIEAQDEIRCELDRAVREGCVIRVNGYDSSRFVLKEFADIWILHPYQISNDATSHNVKFAFDKHKSVVARSWMHLDGSVNTRASLGLKRKMVNIVMSFPGIQDRAIHHKMRRFMSLQDMRTLLDELVADEVLYARLHRAATSKRPNSLFDIGSSPRRQRPPPSILAVSPGDLEYLEDKTDQVHYFPSVNCMEVLGAAACDADLGGQSPGQV